jgi:replicative DNA helicase
VWGLRSHEKRVPEKVFQQPEAAIAKFLRHLWATDGCIKMVGGKAPRPIAYYATSSIDLASDVQSLLVRLGINARLKEVDQKDKGRNQLHVIVTGSIDLEKFVWIVGAVGEYKQQSLAEIQDYLNATVGNTNRDVIPHEIWQMYVRPAMKQSGISLRKLHDSIGIAHCGTTLFKQNVSRDRAKKVAEVVKSEELIALAESDVYWDKISAVEPDGEEEVFDLTVPKYHNFLSCNINIHNSIEQDSDVVMFIYRDDVYNENSERPNEADIIVAKHRNGPTGVATLYFHRELTRFGNLKRTSIDLDNI